MKNAAQAYFQTQVSTTDQGQLLLMLYDGALSFLQQARDKMLAKDYAAKGLLISKTIDIVTELSNTLNMEKGGTLAENLNNLYFLCTARLLQANLKMNVEQLDSVVGILAGLRSAYAQIIETPEAQKASAQIAVRMKTDASMMQRAAPITAPPITATGMSGKVMAHAAYGQQSGQALQAAPGAAPSFAPSSFAAPSFAAPSFGAGPAPVPQPVSPSAPQPASLSAHQTAPVAAPAGEHSSALGLASPMGGFNKRLAAGYGKFAQGA